MGDTPMKWSRATCTVVRTRSGAWRIKIVVDGVVACSEVHADKRHAAEIAARLFREVTS